MNVIRRIGLATLGLGLSALALASCAGSPAAGGPSPGFPPEYAALPDTAVCVVDRSTPLGLRHVDGKTREGSVFLLVGGEVRSLESVHPVDLIAGYAGREEWLTRGNPIVVDGRQYIRTGGERRVGLDLLRRAGEFGGILLFAGTDDPAPADALYVPTSPGCIFQAYVREDLLRR